MEGRSGIPSQDDTKPESTAPSYGTFWQRAAAAGFDGMLFHVVWVGVNALPPGESALWVSMLLFPLRWAYDVGMVALWGQSLGKMFTGIRIVRTDLYRVGFGQALLRQAVAIALGCMGLFYQLRLIAVVPKEILQAVPLQYIDAFAAYFGAPNFLFYASPSLLWNLAELVTMLFHPKRRAIHDLIAGTVVIQTPSAVVQGRPRRALRAAPGLLGWVLISAFNTRSMREPYRSAFPDGNLKGEYVPWGADGTKLVVYWGNGRPRHILSESFSKDSMPRHVEKTWQSFDESGALTRDLKF
jgi:uncharacterized RDD family membrane protein YckC